MSLQKIQSALNAPKDQFNAFGKYKYRSLEGILTALKPLLEEYEYSLTISDSMIEVGGRVYVEATATLCKADGSILDYNTACAREAETKKGMDDAQITGAASSYARKYCLNGMFCIDDTKDADATNTHGKKTPVEKKNTKTVKDAGVLEKYIESIEKNETIKEMDDWTKRMTPHVNQLTKELQGQVWGHYNDWRNTLAS